MHRPQPALVYLACATRRGTTPQCGGASGATLADNARFGASSPERVGDATALREIQAATAFVASDPGLKAFITTAAANDDVHVRNFYGITYRGHNPHDSSFHVQARLGFRRLKPQSNLRLRPLRPCAEDPFRRRKRRFRLGNSSRPITARPPSEDDPHGMLVLDTVGNVIQAAFDGEDAAATPTRFDLKMLEEREDEFELEDEVEDEVEDDDEVEDEIQDSSRQQPVGCMSAFGSDASANRTGDAASRARASVLGCPLAKRHGGDDSGATTQRSFHEEPPGDPTPPTSPRPPADPRPPRGLRPNVGI
eukprot:CAMPEP_0117550014 /NCGR_PEP_ID=MMETSP0784-20121206/48462_1 /TAXON_ID=39447 /ORGANISM="" /LENGTH=306 /DNA_ID=CAMNT_0005347019 /DNA_START=1 /DNA_END=922 /DNA_ORIENTATION=+